MTADRARGDRRVQEADALTTLDFPRLFDLTIGHPSHTDQFRLELIGRASREDPSSGLANGIFMGDRHSARLLTLAWRALPPSDKPARGVPPVPYALHASARND